MKRIITIGLWIGILLATAIVAYAITTLFFTKSQTSEFSKKQIFQFDLHTGLSSGEVGPGDSFSVSPVIYNDATEDMFVFIRVDMPVVDGSPLYTFKVDRDWTQVESDEGVVVYAYTAGSDVMTVLTPGESTFALTEQMTMRSITNAEYAGIDDINIILTGYAIGVEAVPTVPEEAWVLCKQIEDIQ